MEGPSSCAYNLCFPSCVEPCPDWFLCQVGKRKPNEKSPDQTGWSYFFLDGELIWKGPAHCEWCHSWAVVLGEHAMRGSSVSSRPPRSLLQFRSAGSCSALTITFQQWNELRILG